MDGIARHKSHFMNYSTFFVRCEASLLLAVHVYAFSSLIHCAFAVSLCRSLPCICAPFLPVYLPHTLQADAAAGTLPNFAMIQPNGSRCDHPVRRTSTCSLASHFLIQI